MRKSASVAPIWVKAWRPSWGWGLRRLQRVVALDPAGAGLELVDDAGLGDELAGLQPVHVVLPIPPPADDAGIGEAAPEQIDDPLGDGLTPIKADRRSDGPGLHHDAEAIRALRGRKLLQSKGIEH
jgi:hypothetical protein